MNRRFYIAIAGFALLSSTAVANERFDGNWKTLLACDDWHGAMAFSYEFSSSVKDGILHGERGVKNEGGWMQLDGKIGSDGNAIIHADGRVGSSPYAVGHISAGTPYGYDIDATFSGQSGSGHRVGGRPCTAEFTKQ